MFLFVILFGLSMDYHVFILSRIREAYDRGLSTDNAIAHGIKSTAGTVTSAAVVMVGVFSVFTLLPVVDFKEMGIGLAVAVLLDATLVRGVLLPASMKLLGESNWYLPKWLQWLPRLEHEPAPPRRRPTPSRLPRRPGLNRAPASSSTRPGRSLFREGALPMTTLTRRTTVIAGLGIGVLALHVIDDSFLQPQPGTSAGDHLAGGLVPLASHRRRGPRLSARPRRRSRDARALLRLARADHG